MRQCPNCFQAFGAREWRAHIAICSGRETKAEDRGDWAVRKLTDADEQDARAYRYWQSRSPGERIVATWELSEAAYSIKKVD